MGDFVETSSGSFITILDTGTHLIGKKSPQREQLKELILLVQCGQQILFILIRRKEETMIVVMVTSLTWFMFQAPLSLVNMSSPSDGTQNALHKSGLHVQILKLFIKKSTPIKINSNLIKP